MIFQNTLVQGIAFFIPNKKLRHAFRAKYKRKTKYRKLKDKYIELEKQLNTVRKLPQPGPQQFKTFQYLAAMLKAYEINTIVASAGTSHAAFCLAVQEDKFFNCFSVTDERSAAYVAAGISFSSGKPVVIVCTGATASRNYIPALTEAYYRNIPIIAVMFYIRSRNQFNLHDQFTDRSVSQNDIKICQVKLPETLDAIEKRNALAYINASIFNAIYNKKPVIIECPTGGDLKNPNTFMKFPDDFWTTKIIKNITHEDKNELMGKNIAVFVGSHERFSTDEENALETFAQSYNAPVFCNHTSSYYGKNRVQCQLAMISEAPKPDLIIDIGGVTNEGMYYRLFPGTKIHRVSSEGEFKCRNNWAVTKTFVIREDVFFMEMACESEPAGNFYQSVISAISNIEYPELPLSAYLIAKKLSELLPENSIYHYGVSNIKRAVNYFNFKNKIDSSCNVGACGIDGAVSTAVGMALSNTDKRVFAVMGDLTFFYDMNAIQNRDLKDNFRLLINNNNQGFEQKMPGLDAIKELAGKLMAAEGHHAIAEGWAKSCGFHYMVAKNRDEFLNQIDSFCNNEFKKPVIFEVFTSIEDEDRAFRLMQNIGR